MKSRIITGDCVGTMRGMPENSVDSVVTDPPYGLAFMGKQWDKAPTPRDAGHAHKIWAREALRVLKPGGYLLAFGGTRTYHRLACAIEDAGFEIRDSISWLYGSGFPKSHDVSKAIDKMGGKNISWFAPWLKAERKKRGMSAKALAEYFKTSPERINHGGCVSNWELGLNVPTVEQFNKLCEVLELPFERLEEAEREVVGPGPHHSPNKRNNWMPGKFRESIITVPATPAAQQWQGWGTALKPAHEPIVMARKPLSEGTVARNVLEHSTGALNIEASRVDGKRWPANLILSHHEDCNGECIEGCPVAELDRQSGVSGGKARTSTRENGFRSGKMAGQLGHGKLSEITAQDNYGDKGGASRFFYIAKASRKEKGEGNSHPTVKPIALMRYLIRMVTPPGGTVLDPFCGSGSTGCAAVLEGMDFIGIEREEEYVAIAEKRIAHYEEESSSKLFA